jgi:hypothetical protein
LPEGSDRAAPVWISTTPEKVAASAIKAIRRNRGLVLLTPAAHFCRRCARFTPRLVEWLLREGWRRRPGIQV